MAVDNIARGLAAKALASGGGGGTSSEKGVFWCTYLKTTYNEITSAIADGKYPVCKKENDVYVYQGIASNKYVFTSVKNTAVSYIGIGDDNTWSVLSAFTIQVTGNLTTTLSSTSTDKQYPSAKATYDAIQGVREVAEGKTATYVVSYATETAFNSTADTITLTKAPVDVSGNTIPLNKLALGDTFYVVELDVPDRWVSGVGENSVTLSKLETEKVPVTDVQVDGVSVVEGTIAKFHTVTYNVTYADGSTGVIKNLEVTGE